MFQSRRMKSIKVLKRGESEVFIKASVLKSFTTEVTCTVTIKFNGNTPEKAYCECAVANCGLCCHAILVLLVAGLDLYSETPDLAPPKHKKEG